MASLGQDMDKLLPAGGSTMPALVVATLEQVLASLDVAKLEGGSTMEVLPVASSLEQVLAADGGSMQQEPDELLVGEGGEGQSQWKKLSGSGLKLTSAGPPLSL